ncbi:MAG TPA: SCO6880 family protein [Solirubrobacteraceae bacterium]|nr:SCO6880 family protein [Solirubrobacteraceae bacterium]
MEKEATYRFVGEPPHGWFLGMTVAQLTAMAAAGALVVVLVNTIGAVALLAVFPIGALTLFVAFWKRAGLTLLEWTPVTVAYAVGRVAGQQEYRAPAAGHLIPLPSGPELDEVKPEPPTALPAELAEIAILEATLPRFGGVRMGVAYDRRALTYTAVIRCEPRGFYLMSPSEREYQLACYGGLLAMFAREFSPVRRIAWYERSLPPSSNELVEHLHAARRPGIPDADPGMRAMWELLEAHGTGTVDHEVLVALQIDLKRTSARAAASKLGQDKAGACALLAEHTSLLVDQLAAMGVMAGQQAGVRSPAVPSPEMLAKLLRDGIDPFSRRSRDVAPNGQDPGISVEDFGPRARTDGWGHVRTDGALHAVVRVSRWPARDVRSSFLQPLLMDTHEVTRTCAMVMEVLPPEKARRHVERRALSAEGDRAVRARFGKRESARTRLATEAIAQHELELAVGHADVSFAAYVDVSVAEHRGIAALERDFSVVQSSALGAGLQLDRCWGTQAQALTFTLPLARGLA